MKTNHEAVINYIRQAIAACKDDSSLALVKKNLGSALKLVEDVKKKRSTNDAQTKFFAAEAKKNHEKWLEWIKQNSKIILPETPDDHDQID